MLGKRSYTRYFYHCFPQWVGSTELGIEPSYASSLDILRLIFKWGLLLTPEEIVFRGESYRDEKNGLPIRIQQQRLCLTELAEDDLPDHAKVFGPIALEFDQYMLRRIGALPVIYIPQPFSTDPEHDRFALIGQSFVYRLFETYQILSDLAAISEHVETLPATDVQVTVRHSKADSEHYRYSSDMLRKLLRTLTHGKQPFPQLASAMCMLSCFFYPTDAPIAYRLQDDDGRLAYYREREWRIVSNINFRGVPIDKELGSEAASEIASVIDRSFSPYQDEMIHGTTFIHDCRLITTFDGDSIINAVRRILVPLELESQVGQLAQNYKYRGAVVGYSMPA